MHMYFYPQTHILTHTRACVHAHTHTYMLQLFYLQIQITKPQTHACTYTHTRKKKNKVKNNFHCHCSSPLNHRALAHAHTCKTREQKVRKKSSLLLFPHLQINKDPKQIMRKNCTWQSDENACKG